VLGYTSQAHFLLNCGLLDRLKEERSPSAANAAHRLISEAEMGELVKVLAVGRGIDGPLLGFARGDRTHTL
jgi:SAM-dependent MidA family methyltransferase